MPVPRGYKEHYRPDEDVLDLPSSSRFFRPPPADPPPPKRQRPSDTDSPSPVAPQQLAQFADLLSAVVGSVDPQTASRLFLSSDGNVERAINMYLDQSGASQRSEWAAEWATPGTSQLEAAELETAEQGPSQPMGTFESPAFQPPSHSSPSHSIEPREPSPRELSPEVTRSPSPSPRPAATPSLLNSHTAPTDSSPQRRSPATSPLPSTRESTVSPQPRPATWSQRFLGSFQAEVWATRSGNKLVGYQERLRVDRVAAVPSMNSSSKPSFVQAKEDFIVRVFNSKNQDFARLSESDARIVALLIDTNMCIFTATCIYAEDKVRLGDYMIIQIDCYVQRTAFTKDIVLPATANRALGLRRFAKPTAASPFDNTSESGDERIMRLRQMALVGLFAKLGLSSDEDDEAIQKSAGQDLRNAVDTMKPDQLQPSPDEEEGTELQQDQLDTLYRRTEAPDANLAELDPAESLKFKLRSYQKKGLNWMIQKETPDTATSQVTQLQGDEIMHPLWRAVNWPSQKGHEIDDASDVELLPDERFYANLYSGELSLKFPQQKRSVMGGILADEMGLGKTISTLALIHSNQDPFDTEPPPRYAANTTLVVAPMSLLSQWESESYDASQPDAVKVLVYYGSSTTELNRFLADAHPKTPRVIVTSYGTLLSEHAALTSFRKRNYAVNNDTWTADPDTALFGLYGYHFYRVVLDEGHTIRNRSTKTAKACYDLRALKRWVLTGTPIVNKLEDLYSLIRFLGIEPWNNFAFWRAFVTVPFQSKGYVKALGVVQSIMEPLILRRTKAMKQADGRPLIELPPKTVTIERIQFSEDEKALYSFVFARARSSFNQQLEQGSVMKSYSAILLQIMRLRQVCCHPLLISAAARAKKLADKDALEDMDAAPPSEDDPLGKDFLENEALQNIVSKMSPVGGDNDEHDISSYGINVMKNILEEVDRECPICTTEPIPQHQLALTGCWHVACLDCILKHIEFQKGKGQTPKCVTCREVIDEDKLYQVIRRPDGANKFKLSLKAFRKGATSAKLRALLGKLQQTQGTGVKSVVFSQFTSFFDIIQEELVQHGIQPLRFDGTLSQKARAEVLTQFREDPTKTVMLISLKAGGVGLNLVCAQHAYMMDPWWSYAVEAQAIDRIHRMGQTSDVRVIRFIVEGTVEERMLLIQDRKQALASTIGMSEEEKKAQRLDDIKLLFESGF